ncbi:hypothetical protein [Longimicrobium sp.]|nr:hypothetical protein [Longimicrobium sp.]HEX6038308.1 hypothetical protein [Longimicrobium sp.]
MARFISERCQMRGNYTEEREALLSDPPVDEFFAEIHRREALRARDR